MSVSQIRQEIRDLKVLRSWLAVVFVVSILLPIPMGATAFYQLENSSNRSVTSFEDALEYALDVTVGTKLTNFTAVTLGGKIISSLLAVLKLVFFGFIASIIMTWLEIYIKERELSYLRGSDRNVH